MFVWRRAPLVRSLPGLLLLLLFGAGCASNGGYDSNREYFELKPVRAFQPLAGAPIGLDLAAVPDRISLKQQRDFAVWVSQKGTTLKIDFNKNGTPFPSGQPLCQFNFCFAGPPEANTAREEPYKYQICINDNCKDPELKIKN